MYSVIKPLLTEKSAAKMSEGLYVMTITEGATKTSVAQDLKKLFNVEVTGVRIINLPAKKVRFKARKGTQSAIRKAYIQLKKGQQLPGFEVKKEDRKADKEKA
ncbi:MAG: 50S ribosomal protein L23 [Candidatus Berkelbacteria bacterium]|nr:MAG: 50S ribosomal protein L23 [Candidatus Berkelbacteria bacterium]QQG52094.1 MAG: 50S ribosomal protein L23 [Candidatus Berkelbacteria bacterium]